MEEFKPSSHNDTTNSDIYEHPTFGVISFGRVQGTPMPLFGSSVKHMHSIRVEIRTATLHRSLSKDWIMGDKIIVSAYMSPSQFADAITGMNSGETPITLDWVTGKGHIKEQLPYQNKVEQFNREFDKHITDLSKDFDEVIRLAEDTHAQKRLVKAIELLKQGFKNNLPFVNEQFSEQMEHTVTEAKGEVEAFVNHMVQSYGIEAIRNQAPQLPQAIDSSAKELPAPKDISP